MATADNEVYKH